MIEESIGEWTGTDFEVSVLMANSEIMVDLGEIKKAIDILKTVDRTNSNFVQSRK